MLKNPNMKSCPTSDCLITVDINKEDLLNFDCKSC